jgi:hypothetical protein
VKRRLNNAPRHVRQIVLDLIDHQGMTARQVADIMPGVNRHNLMQWLAGKERPQLSEGTIDRIIQVVTKAPKVP